MNKHAKFSPSAAHRWITCPGSIRMSEGITAEPSQYALEGTALHMMVEKCLREKRNPYDLISQKFNPEGDYWLELNEDNVEAVKYCVDQVTKLTQENKMKGGKLEVKVEINENCWGTVDVLLWNDEEIWVIDFKFGKGLSVEAEGNPQLMLYGLAALQNLYINKLISSSQRLNLIILQPRIPNPFRSWTIDYKSLTTWYTKSVEPAFDEAEKSDSVCNPGEAQCKFCPANGVCSARADYLLEIVQEEFKPYQIKEGENLPAVEIASLTDKMKDAVDYLTPEIAGRILQYQDDFDNFFKRVGEYALESALNGEKIPGFKVVEGRSNRKWKLKDDEMRQILVQDFNQSDPTTRKIWSPTQAEKKMKGQKDALADYITKPRGKNILVLESDTRPEIDLAAKEEFEEFANETVTANSPPTIEEPFIKEVSSSSLDDLISQLEPSSKEPEIQVNDGDIIMQGKNSSQPADKRTLKYKLLEKGIVGKASISAVAEELYKSNEKGLKAGLRSLNERDGYTIIIHNDNTFTIKEA